MEDHHWDQYAKDYEESIITPFHKGVSNPLLIELEKINGETVADIGTGVGNLIPYLSKNFTRVYAIDFSSRMLEKAKINNIHLKNITFIRKDIRELSSISVKFDVAIAVNSILHPSSKHVNKTFKEIYKCLKPGGTFLGIFPSLEAMIYTFSLVYERELAKYDDEQMASAMTNQLVNRKRFNFISGIFDSNGEKQKWYYKFELRNRMKNAGFRNIRFRKVLYPWESELLGLPIFVGKPKIWDWYVTANKST